MVYSIANVKYNTPPKHNITENDSDYHNITENDSDFILLLFSINNEFINYQLIN